MLTKNQENLIDDLKQTFESFNTPKVSSLSFIQRFVKEVQEENEALRDAKEYNTRILSELLDDLLRQINEVVDSLDSIGVKVVANRRFSSDTLKEYLSNIDIDYYRVLNGGLHLGFTNYELNKEFEFFVKFHYSTNKIHSKEFVKYTLFTFCRETNSVRYETLNDFLQNEPRFESFVKSLLNGK